LPERSSLNTFSVEAEPSNRLPVGRAGRGEAFFLLELGHRVFHPLVELTALVIEVPAHHQRLLHRDQALVRERVRRRRRQLNA